EERGLIIAATCRLKQNDDGTWSVPSQTNAETIYRYERWYDQKYGVTRHKCVWVKTHIACGTKTNVVTAVRILDKDAADCPQFVPLVKETRKGFEIDEVSADKAYLSVDNFETVAQCGGQAFIAFKSNSNGMAGGLFEKAFHYFQFKQDEYMDHYHKRSNV